MILVDTNIIIDFWKNPSPEYYRIFKSQNIFISGICKAELMHGAKSESDLLRIKNAISQLPELEISFDFWTKVGFNLYSLRKSGMTVPFQDVVIATHAIENKCSLWSLDKHFKLIQPVLKELVLFQL